MPTVVPTDAPCYVTQCYRYTPDGYPQQEGCITSVYFQSNPAHLGKMSTKFYFLTQDYEAADLRIT